MDGLVEPRYPKPNYSSEGIQRKLVSALSYYAVASGRENIYEMKKYALEVRSLEIELGRKPREFPTLGIINYS